MEQRWNAVKEVLQTENTYAVQLDAIVACFVEPLRAIASKDGKTVVSIAEIDDLFSNIEVIAKFTDAFLKELHVSLNGSGSTDAACIGPAFLAHAPFFKLYAQYVDNHETATKTFLQVSKRPAFQRFLAASALDPRLGGLDLPSLLITPVQRVPRYKLLLETLLQCTEESHPDRSPLESAHAAVSTVAKSINDAITESQNRSILFDIQREFSGSVELIVPHRRFLMQGVLTKRCRAANKDFTFFLFNDLFLYAHGGGLSQYKLNRAMPIEYNLFTVNDLPDDGDDCHRIEVLHVSKSFVVYTKTAAEKDKWLSTLRLCIEEASKRRGADREGETLKAVWEPNSASRTCSVCQSSFGILRRRHHCRSCGKLVCGDCSKGRLFLDLKTNKKERVCDACYTKGHSFRSSLDSTMYSKTYTAPVSEPPRSVSVSTQPSQQQLMGELATQVRKRVLQSSHSALAPSQHESGYIDSDSDESDEVEVVRDEAIEQVLAKELVQGSHETGVLGMKEGDTIIIQYSDVSEEGYTWCFGQNTRTGCYGWVDPNTTRSVATEPDPMMSSSYFAALDMHYAVESHPGSGDSGELVLAPGDKVYVSHKDESGFWYAINRSSGQEGWVDPKLLRAGLRLQHA